MTVAIVRLLVKLRWMSVVDAITYLILVGVAMPLKYLADMPLAVSVVGMIHGVAWMFFMWLLMRARFEAAWPRSRLWLLGVAALVPIVPFFLDRSVREWVAAEDRARP